MKAFRFFLVFLPLVLLLVACGGTEGTAPPDNTQPSPQICTVTLDAGRGTLQSRTLICASGTRLELPTPTATDTSIVFVGWSQNGAPPVRSIIVETDMSLQAVWQSTRTHDFSYTTSTEGITLVAYHGSAARIEIPTHIDDQPVIALGVRLFADNTILSAVTIPHTVQVLGEEVFAGCTALTSVTLPTDLTALPDRAFFGCTALTSIAIPGTVSTCGNACFAGCTALNALSFSDALTTLGAHAFADCTELISLSLGNKLTALPHSMALGCKQLAEFELPQALIRMEAFALSGTSLRTISLPAGVAFVGDRALAACDSLTSVTLSSATGTLGAETFAGCTALTQFYTANAPLTAIGARAFFGCAALTKITLPTTLTALGEEVFAGCVSLVELTVPFVGAHPLDSHSFGYFFDGNAHPLCAKITKNDESFYLPRSLVTVHITGNRLPAGAFAGCYTLQTITLAESLSFLPDRAFDGCGSLTTITLPEALNTIGARAFAGCVSLTSIRLPAQLRAIADDSFLGCVRMTTLYADCAHMIAQIGTHPLKEHVLVLYLSDPIAASLGTSAPDGYTRAVGQDTILYTKYVKTLG